MLQLRSSVALARALDQPIDPDLRELLALRIGQLGLEELADTAWFAIVQPGDTVGDVEAELGFPLSMEGEPTFEWMQAHAGGIYELTFIFSDDHAHVLLVQERGGIDASLLALCREYVTNSDSPAGSERTAQA